MFNPLRCATLLPLALGVALAACDSTNAVDVPAELRTDRDAYVRGDSVRVTLASAADVPLYGSVPRCVGFETQTGAGWEPVPSWPSGCSLALFVLGPGESTAVAFAVPEAVPAGTYRFTKTLTTALDVATDDVRLATPPFTISGPSIEGLVYRVQEETFAMTDSTATLVLENGTDGVVGYNLCHSTLQREIDGRWVDVRDYGPCTDELRTLAPGERAELPLPLPDGLVTAGYRYETRIEIDVDGERASRTIRTPVFGLPRP